MPNIYSIGPNNSIAIYDENGIVDFGRIISFKSNADEMIKDINLMSGVTDHLKFDHGWKGEFNVQRTSGALDKYWAASQAAVRQGLPEKTFTVIQTIKETDSTVTRFSFLNVIMKYDDAGMWENEEGVVQRFSMMCAVREDTSA